ncbi:MAG: segregation/condensation protein A [Actinomycetota bacterium]|nr:segregation/condensation protein A [Actinomycetota bacterium]
MSYPVKLDVYEGPLDLLLQLVSKQRVDVTDISISSVTDEFLKATRALEDVDLETATTFLVLAATLLELKSLKLLPQSSASDPDLGLLLEERDRLLHRLIVYSTFKSAGSWLRQRLADNEGFHARVAELPEELVPAAPDIFQGLTPGQVGAAAGRVLASRQSITVDTSHVTPATVSLEQIIDELGAKIEAEGQCSFRGLCRHVERMKAVVSFLALLELYRRELVEIHQADPFAEITVTWKPRRPEELG